MRDVSMAKEVSMVLARQINPVVRAVAVIASVMALVTGVTFAALQDSVTLENNTIASANADLLIWNGSSFQKSAAGFTVTGLVPGQGSAENFFYLKNNGANPLTIKASVPADPAAPDGGYDFSGWENLTVKITGYAPGCADPVVNTTMQALLAGNVAMPCNPLAAGAQGDSGNQATAGNYSMKFDIDPDSVTGDSPGVGSFDIVLNGTAVAIPNPET